MSTYSCVVCGETKGFKLCSRCGLVGYCSIEHQKQDWKKTTQKYLQKTRQTSPSNRKYDNKYNE